VCRDKSDAPSTAPNLQGLGISELNNSDTERSRTSQAVKISCGVTGAIVAVIIIVVLALRTKRKSVSYEVSEKIIYDEEEECFGLSMASTKTDFNSHYPPLASSNGFNSMYPPVVGLPMEASTTDFNSHYPPLVSSNGFNSMYPPAASSNLSNSLYPRVVSSLPKSSSFIAVDQNNLGGKHSTKDVQCCDHFPCENCRAENKVIFVSAKGNQRKAKKAGFEMSKGQKIEIFSESMRPSFSGESERTITV